MKDVTIDGRTILVVDDEVQFAQAMATRLTRDGADCRVAETISAARDALAPTQSWQPDLVLLDMRLPDGSGLDLVPDIVSSANRPPVIVITAFGDIDNAVEAMKRGASDYLRKPLDLDELALVVRRVLASRDLEARLDYAREREVQRIEPAALLGRSPAVKAIRSEIAAIAALPDTDDAPAPNVLITGDTGTGKDIAARQIHLGGPRASRPFVRIDCATLPRETIEADLFGRAGEDEEPGLIEAAENGTVLFDEICELPVELQAKLLPVIERRRLRRLGASREHAVAARFIATTNRDPDAAIAENLLRSDLYYRLNVLGIRMPNLRDCDGDAVLLARHFIAATARRYARPEPALSEASETALSIYDWPGNVRELEHLIERAVLLSDGASIGPRHLPLSVPAGDQTNGAANGDALPNDIGLEDAERQLMLRALEKARGNVSAAARALGITRMAMRYRMEKHGI